MLVLALLLFFSPWTAEMVGSYVEFVAQRQGAQESAARLQLVDAAAALESYMVFRAGDDLAIAKGTSPIEPRLLQLPCPDIVGGKTSDNALDGAQDPYCGSIRTNDSSINRTRKFLDSGSRFGRLPWRTRLQKDLNNKVAVNDGVHRSFEDAEGNRFWYVVARNMAPNKQRVLGDDEPEKYGLLNFHSLITDTDEFKDTDKEKGWLEVVNQNGDVISDQAAAVVLSPNKTRGGRHPESYLLTASLTYSNDVSRTRDGIRDGGLHPEKFFESLTINETVYSNATWNGVFIQAPASEEFDDGVAYIDIKDMIRPGSAAYEGYKKVVGITQTHNLPGVGTPLAMTRDAIMNYVAMHGVYPTPAANSGENLGRLERYCAAYHSPTVAITLPATAPLTLITPTELTVSSLDGVTVTVTAASNFLLVTATVIAADITDAVINDITATVTAVTLYAETTINLAAATLSVIGAPVSVSAGIAVLSVSTTVNLLTTVDFILPSTTPIKPGGNLIGWLPSTKVTASADIIKLPNQPPCFDPADFKDRRQFTFFTQDQPMFYAVAENHYYGGSGSDGFTVSVAAGAQVAAPEEFALSQTLVLIADDVTVSISNGESAINITLPREQPIKIINNAITIAEITPPVDLTLTQNETVTIAAQSKINSVSGFNFNDVPALIIYSPAPLRRVNCAIADDDLPSDQTQAVEAPSELMEYCYWLDDNENTNGDNTYIIHPQKERRHSNNGGGGGGGSGSDNKTLTNDYFLLFAAIPTFP